MNEINLNTEQMRVEMYKALNDVLSDAMWCQRHPKESGAIASADQIALCRLLLAGLRS